MKERVLQEFKYQYEKKFNDTTLLDDFFKSYVLDTIKDEDILNELNKKGRDLKNVQLIDYLENESILIRTVKVCVLLELSKDYTAFKKLNKKIAQDKQHTYKVEFDKLLKALIKIEPK
ncbi:hypothetical protein [Chryseobacterium mucoviscidosis]|uniref:hypothetical protein n=1 Tax=Chryseobacterium mucoviscidosis TaxID=1945581 RepID=UPI0031D55C0A